MKNIEDIYKELERISDLCNSIQYNFLPEHRYEIKSSISYIEGELADKIPILKKEINKTQYRIDEIEKQLKEIYINLTNGAFVQIAERTLKKLLKNAEETKKRKKAKSLLKKQSQSQQDK